MASRGGNLFRLSSSPSSPTATLSSTTSFVSSKKSQLRATKASKSNPPLRLNRFPHHLCQRPILPYHPSRCPLLWWTFRPPNRCRPRHPSLPQPPQKRPLLRRSHLLRSLMRTDMQTQSMKFPRSWPRHHAKNHRLPSLNPHLPWNLRLQLHHPPRHLQPPPFHLNLLRLLPPLNLHSLPLRLCRRHGPIWPQPI